MIAAFVHIQAIAPALVPVLITGETGVGKDVAANAVHHFSRRRKPMVTINCGGVPDALMETELFGHERGAFTGAVTSQPGQFELAAGGTLFLDEIAELPPRSQGTLLRVLDGKPITRVGGRSTYRPNVRIVAATNRNLELAVLAGTFREDLYFRLCGAAVHLPPLRQRQLDLPLLAEDLLDAARSATGRPPLTISRAALDEMAWHSWPGNVRELRHAMQLVAHTCDKRIVEVLDLPDRVARGASKERERRRSTPEGSEYETLSKRVEALERHSIREALDACGGNQTRAAERLGMPRRTLVRKLKQFKIADKPSDEPVH